MKLTQTWIAEEVEQNPPRTSQETPKMWNDPWNEPLRKNPETNEIDWTFPNEPRKETNKNVLTVFKKKKIDQMRVERKWKHQNQKQTNCWKPTKRPKPVPKMMIEKKKRKLAHST